jgi:hypothetical protein
MKNIRQYIITAALATGCIFLLLELIKKSSKLEAIEGSRTNEDNQVKTQAKEIVRKMDSSGIETVTFDINSNKASPTENILSRKTKGILDTTALALDLRTKQLKQIMLLKSIIEAENIQLRRQLDSSNLPYYTYNGDGLRLKFIPSNANDTAGHAEFTANVQIKATQFWRRSWLLGFKKDYIAISSDNPMFKINNLEYLEIEQKQNTVGFKIQASSSYNLRSGIFTYGPSARLDVGRLSLTGYHGRGINSSKWSTQLSASYDLLSF